MGLLIAGGLLVLLNGLRVAALILIGWKKPSIFHEAHMYLGQVLMVFSVVGISTAWIRFDIGARLKQIPLGFLLRFSAISGILFILWSEVNRTYIGLGDFLIREIFSWWGYRLTLPRQHALYYHTFSVVAFTALVLATQPMRLGERVGTVALGMGVLASLHLVVRVCNVLTTGLQMEWAERVSIAIGSAAQYIVPFFLWARILGKRKKGLQPR